jgi:hypothetical protein
VKTVSLDDVLGKFSGRISKLPFEFQAILFKDLETAIERRLLVLEKFGLKCPWVRILWLINWSRASLEIWSVVCGLMLV